MLQILLVVALGSLQQGNTILRGHPDRGEYQTAVDTCAEAEKLLATSPEAALDKLAPIFTSWIDKNRFALIERGIVIEGRALEYKDHDFYPYYLRGSARLFVARKRKDEEARRLLIDATNDLQASVTRKAERSQKPLAEAHKELWANVKAALTYEAGWKSARAGFVEPAVALLAASDLAKEAADWIASEIVRVENQLRALRKTVVDLEARRLPARQAAEWCETIAAAVRALPALQPPILKARALAASIADSKGTFRLKIGVSPWAKVEQLKRAGEVITLADRDTPLLVPQELEIDDYTVELVHPNGRKTAPIPAKSLLPGRTYVLWGDMSGNDFTVSEQLPK